MKKVMMTKYQDRTRIEIIVEVMMVTCVEVIAVDETIIRSVLTSLRSRK